MNSADHCLGFPQLEQNLPEFIFPQAHVHPEGLGVPHEEQNLLEFNALQFGQLQSPGT